MLTSVIASAIIMGGQTAQQALEKVLDIYKASKSIDVIYTLKQQQSAHRSHVLIVKNAGWASEVLASKLFRTGYRAYERQGQSGYIIDPSGRKCGLQEVALAVNYYVVSEVGDLVGYPAQNSSWKPKDWTKAFFGPEKSWQGKPAIQISIVTQGSTISYYLNTDYTRILGLSNVANKESPDGTRMEVSYSFDKQKFNTATSKDLDAWIARAEKLVKP